VGIPTAGATVSGQSAGGSIGLGFAIPVDLAESVADEIIATGRVTNAFIGVQTVPISRAADAEVGGLLVQAVSPDGPAAAAGLRPRALITNVDGSAATDNLQLEKIALTERPGDTLSLGYDRAGHSSHAVITVTAQP
jgi:putative serine protease PepD